MYWVGERLAGWLIPMKSLAEIVRMPERRGVAYLYCGTFGVIGVETEDIGLLRMWVLLVLSSPRHDCARVLGSLGAI